MAELVVADTSVLSYLTKDSPTGGAYTKLIANRTLAISFQSVAELLSADFSARRAMRLRDALEFTVKLPHADETNLLYARIARMRKRLKFERRVGGDAGDADVWIISSALQYELPLVSHDRQQVALGRAAGVPILTALPR